MFKQQRNATRNDARDALTQSMNAMITRLMTVFTIVAIISVTITALFPDSYAIAANGNSPYMDLNVAHIFDPDVAANANGSASGAQASGNTLWTGMTSIIQTITTAIILPIGIIMSTWRSLYLAVFCYIAGYDPLKMLNSPRYQHNNNSETAVRDFGVKASFINPVDNASSEKNIKKEAQITSMIGARGARMQWSQYQNVMTKRALLIEVKHLFLGLFITFAVWIGIQICIWLAVIILQIVGGFGVA